MQDDYKYNVSEEGLRDWFGKSSGTTKSGRKVRGWVQVGGKYDETMCKTTWRNQLLSVCHLLREDQ